MTDINQKSFFNRIMCQALVCLIAMLLLLGSDGCGTSKKYNIVIDDSLVDGLNIWKKYQLRRNVETAIHDVTQYFDTTYQDTLQVYVYESGRMEAHHHIIYVDKASVGDKRGIIHETTHAILGMRASSFEIEGMAEFVSNKLTNVGKLYKKRYLKLMDEYDFQIFSIRFLIANDQLFLSDNGNTRYAYAQAGLFYQFLEERYGKKKLMELHKLGLGKIEQVYGANVDSLDYLWHKWMFGEHDVKHESR